MTVEVDLIVVGTGSAAQSVAFPCREAGWSVMVVDSDPFGGTCQLRGCDPKKVLVGVSELIDWGRRMQGNGLSAPAPALSWPDMARFKRTFTDGVPAAMDQRFKEAGVLTVHGRARFVGPTSLRVGDDTYAGRHVVIAAGARHAPLGIPGEEHLTTSSGFLALEALPRRVAFVGGGYIAFEFAHIAARAGVEVTVLHRGTRPLEGFDPDLVAQLLEGTRGLGVDVRLGTSVGAVEERGDGRVVHAGTATGEVEVGADLVVHAAGRVPEVDDLDLGAAGVERGEKGGVAVNEYLQSVSNPAVYAAGDAVSSGGLPLTPVAGMQGRTVAANLLDGNTRTPDYLGIPTVVFTTPPLARVGLDEATARAQGLGFRAHHEDTSGWYSSRRIGLTHTGFKTLVEDGTERVLGAHLLGPHAEETINIFALAIRKGLNASDLKDMVFAYPSSASDIGYML
ncbi:MAG: NAD(P)/FAD-dependent oxidoreductase [Actinomycetota bacterium]|jgi:glutathione reductase (NADPH)|nr:NAD(P)/FAD-dependent oxidoreductase [Actinomycetota bacterium]